MATSNANLPRSARPVGEASVTCGEVWNRNEIQLGKRVGNLEVVIIKGKCLDCHVQGKLPLRLLPCVT